MSQRASKKVHVVPVGSEVEISRNVFISTRSPTAESSATALQGPARLTGATAATTTTTTTTTTPSSPSTTDNNDGSGLEDAGAQPREGETYRAYRKRRHRETETVRRDRINISLTSLKTMLGLAAATDHASVLEKAVEALEAQLAGLPLPSFPPPQSAAAISPEATAFSAADTSTLLSVVAHPSKASPTTLPPTGLFVCARCGAAVSEAADPCSTDPAQHIHYRATATSPTPMEGLLPGMAWASSTSAGDSLHQLDTVMTALEDFLGPGPGAAGLVPLSPGFAGSLDLASFLPTSPSSPAFLGEERLLHMAAPALSTELANVDVAAAAAASSGALMDPSLDSHYLSNRTGLFIVACSLHILDCNHALATLLGTTRSYLLGKRATELGIKGENPVARAALIQLMTGQKRTFITVEHARKVAPPSELHWIRCTVVALSYGPMDMCQFIGVMEAIDEPLDGEQIQVF